MPHNLFEGNTYRYILTSIDVTSRYKVARTFRTKKSNEVAFVLEAIYKNGGVCKYRKSFQCDNGSEFENEATKLLEKHNVEIRRATTKQLEKLLFKSMDAQQLQDHKKCQWFGSKIWIRLWIKLTTQYHRWLIGMKPKDAIKLDTVRLNISKRNLNTQGRIIEIPLLT